MYNQKITMIFDHVQEPTKWLLITIHQAWKTNSQKKSHAEFFEFEKFNLQNLANKSGCVQTNLLYFLFITSEAKQYYEALYLSYRPRTECSISQFFKTNCTQSIFRTINRGLLVKPFKNFQNDLYGQLVLTFGKRQICSASCGRLFE